MPSLSRKVLGKGLTKVPGVKRLPVMKLLAIGEIAILARSHYELLDAKDRHRLVELVRKGRGRKANLSARDRKELTELIAKVEPKRFAILAADKLSPVPLPGAKRLARPADRQPSG
jgi:hypothetical protein